MPAHAAAKPLSTIFSCLMGHYLYEGPHFFDFHCAIKLAKNIVVDNIAERLLHTPEVHGSNPVFLSKFTY